MLTLFEIAALLLFLSAVFSWLNHAFLKLPHTIGLLVMALVASLVLLGLEVAFPAIGLTDTLQGALGQIDFNATVMNGMLAFLLFAGALHVNFAAMRERKLSIGMMATFGVVLSTFIVGAGFWAIAKLVGAPIPFIWALVFGSLISPTDPVAVLSILKSVKMPAMLEAKIAGESLFNDGVGVVVFTIMVAIATGGASAGHAEAGVYLLAAAEPVAGGHGGSVTPLQIAELFFVEAGGGAILGLLAGWVAVRAIASIDEAAIEILISLGLVTALYALCQRLHLSGPIAVVVAGLVIGNRGKKVGMSERTKAYLFGFWEMVDEILNSVLFLLIGLEILILGFTTQALIVVLLTIPLVLFARLTAVSIPIKLLGAFESFTKGAIPVLTWGGVRGGISVALALSLPDSEYKPLILSATYGVVIFSIIVQGLTVKRVVARSVQMDDPNIAGGH